MPWQLAQAAPRDPRCGSLWQEAQSPFRPRNETSTAARPFGPAAAAAAVGTWQAAHFADACLPVSGKRVFAAWSKGAPRNARSSWQAAQSFWNSPRWGSRWHAAHVSDRGFTFAALSRWQATQATAACRPRSGNAVLAWSTFVVRKEAVSWHAEQSAPSAFRCGSW